MHFKAISKRVWKFVWKDDSIYSWIVNIILAFILVKFLIYPGLGLLLATTHPVVAVVSGSMEHNGMDFNDWWRSQSDVYENYGFSKQDAKEWDFRNGFNKGDIMVLRGVKPNKIELGDVIVFRGTSEDPIIHRVIRKERQNDIWFFQTKGDNNPDSFKGLGEINIIESKVIGKAVFKIPFLGWVKIIAVNVLNQIRF